ncbi:M23 family metallopeptidase [Nocardiopsis kunsanensis]|uniref:M23 family metallopeptidase n=1 Tax=Nocardiopsis kunsanensis TaxID=141693 RepID=UPI0003487382
MARGQEEGRAGRRLRWCLIRVHGWTVPVLFAVIAVDIALGGPMGAWFLLLFAVAGSFYAGVLLWLRSGREHAAPEPVEVGAPVTGEWFALNGPADKVPSHGVRFLGQEYAIDLIAVSGERPVSVWWPPMSPNAAFPAFGRPLPAVAEAEVVHVEDGARDHLSRDTYPALLHLFAEGLVRQAAGAHRILGNHVVLDLGGGVYALYAHLRRGSARVRPGDRVAPGQVLGECGNSGNSSEPHLHFQLMDAADPRLAVGVPFTWRGVGVPANGTAFSVPGHQ